MHRQALSLVVVVSVLVAVGTIVDIGGNVAGTTSEFRIGTPETVGDTNGDNQPVWTERSIDAVVRDAFYERPTNSREIDLYTDSGDTDTDGDGFPDELEVTRNDVLSDADPDRIDVYVEVDSVAGATIPAPESERVVTAFDAAPIGSNESKGVNLHLVFDETGLEENGPVRISDRKNQNGSSVRLESYVESNHDYRGYGYHYLLVVPEILDVTGYEILGESNEGVMLVQSVDREGVMGSTFMHELGHSLGLDRDDFDGIDTRRYPVAEYPSVMNYNSRADYYRYSSGEPFDDWSAIEADLHVPDMERFNASR